MPWEKSGRIYDLLYSWKDYEAEANHLREIITERLPSATPGTVPDGGSRGESATSRLRVLDVACGTGRHLELLRPDFEVEGLDLDPGFVELARERNQGIHIHQGDMMSFDLGRTFDVVMCLFSSIGYATTEEQLRTAAGIMARHLSTPGLLIIEPWLHPDGYEVGHLGSLMVEDEDISIARLNLSERIGDISIMDMHHLVGTRDGIEYFVEHHEMGLFTPGQYLDALEAAGLEPEHDPEGLMGRGLFLGMKRPETR